MHPSSKIIEINNGSTSVTFTCKANGSSFYEWQRQSGDVPPNAEGHNLNTLTLHNILPEHSGHYRCIAENMHGKNYSKFAMLTVEGTAKCFNIVSIMKFMYSIALPPVVNIQSPDGEMTVAIKRGESTLFNCNYSYWCE